MAPAPGGVLLLGGGTPKRYDMDLWWWRGEELGWLQIEAPDPPSKRRFGGFGVLSPDARSWLLVNGKGEQGRRPQETWRLSLEASR